MKTGDFLDRLASTALENEEQQILYDSTKQYFRAFCGLSKRQAKFRGTSTPNPAMPAFTKCQMCRPGTRRTEPISERDSQAQVGFRTNSTEQCLRRTMVIAITRTSAAVEAASRLPRCNPSMAHSFTYIDVGGNRANIP
jgi:hypothetical protein